MKNDTDITLEEELEVKLGEKFGYIVYGSFHRARKEKRCTHCNKKIEKGNIYYLQTYGRFFYETFGSIPSDAYCLDCALKYLPYKKIKIYDKKGNILLTLTKNKIKP